MNFSTEVIMKPDRKDIERRDLADAELRLAEDNDSPKVVGYAARFGVWTDIGGMFRERILQGAFKKTLKEADVRALIEHDPMMIIGRNKAGTLRMNEDDKGLAVEIDVPDTSYGRDLIVSMKRGDKTQMSFGFQAIQTNDNYDEDTREIKEAKLFDVSVVSYPAYPTTTAQVRSAFQQKQEERSELDELWQSIFTKLRSGEEMTEEERQLFIANLPENISAPVENHVETEDEPGETHSDTDWLVERSKITQKLYDIGGLLQ
jgi:HK97 family phage prohead protease